MNREQARRNAAACHAGLKIVEEYARQRVYSDLEEILKPHDHTKTLWAMYLRAQGWLSTLVALGDAKHYQAIATGARSLFEVVIDMILLQRGEDPAAVSEKIQDWDKSARLKHAECYVQFTEARALPKDGSYPFLKERVDAEAKAIKAARKKHWNRSSHPKTWTSHDLLENARAADKLYPDLALEQWYETDYRQICWYVHGSGLAGVRTLEESGFFILCGLATYHAARFEMECCKLAYMGTAGMWNDRKIHFRHALVDARFVQTVQRHYKKG